MRNPRLSPDHLELVTAVSALMTSPRSAASKRGTAKTVLWVGDRCASRVGELSDKHYEPGISSIHGIEFLTYLLFIYLERFIL